jgi:hypothetical protein
MPSATEAAVDDITHRLLKSRGRQALAAAEPAVQELVRRVLERCADGIRAVEAFDLTPYELQDAGGSGDLSTWNAVAPHARNLLVEVRRVIDDLEAMFPDPAAASVPSTADIDAAFAFEPASQRDAEVQSVVAGSDPERASAGPAVRSLTGMLEQDLLRFGGLIRNQAVTTDRWLLLGALHEMGSNCAQCLDAVTAVVMQDVTTEPPERVLSRYVDVTRRALRLRFDVRDLRFEVEALQLGLNDGRVSGEDAAARLAELLQAFSGRASYRTLRPTDKRELLECRAWAARDGSQPERRLEDFLRWLEVMDGINRREHLVKSDRQNLSLSVMLLESDEPLDAVWTHVQLLYGRDRALDEIVRAWRQHQPPDREELSEALSTLREQLTAGA